MNEFHLEKINEFSNELKKFKKIVIKSTDSNSSSFEYNESNVYRLTKIYNLLKQVQDDICILEEDLYKPF
jgi:hypothetical protein